MSLWKNIPLKPMLLGEVKKPFNDKEYIFEIKFDGIRAVIYATPKNIKIYSRNGNDITHLYPELHSIKNLVTTNTIFDGEIVLFKNNVPSFKSLLERTNTKSKEKIKFYSKKNPVNFMCFDILYEGKDLTTTSLIKRKNILSKYEDTEVFNKTFFLEEKGINLYKEITKLDLEGIVAKKKNSLYHIGKRSDVWLKIKNIKEGEFVVGGYIINKNTISLLLGEFKDNKLYYVGKVPYGKKYQFSKKIINEKKLKLSTFVNYNEIDVNYISPKNKIKVKYLEKTKNNQLRHPFI